MQDGLNKQAHSCYSPTPTPRSLLPTKPESAWRGETKTVRGVKSRQKVFRITSTSTKPADNQQQMLYFPPSVVILCFSLEEPSILPLANFEQLPHYIMAERPPPQLGRLFH